MRSPARHRQHAARFRRRVSAGAAGLLAITGTAAGLAATATATGSAQPGRSAAARIDNALIAATAQQYIGRWGGQACVDSHHDASGQCKQFVNCVVALATGGKKYPVDPGGDYQNSYLDAGGVEVTAAAATVGDIVQVGEHDADPDLHTAIITARRPGGAFTVVDANWIGVPATPELVGVHDYTPPTRARFWRLGTVTSGYHSAATTAASAQDGAAPGSIAVPAAPALAGAHGAAEFGTVTASTGPHSPAPAMIRFWLDGHPQATLRITADRATLHVDTATLADGPHELAAQAITATGIISPLSPNLRLDIADHAPAISATVPSAAVHAGNIQITVSAGPALDITAATLDAAVDGHTTPTARTTTGPGHAVLSLDTRTLTSGPHQITVTAADGHGHTATAPPLQLTTAPVAAIQPVAIDAASSGRSDLIALDTAGNLLHYPATDTDTLGKPQMLHPSPGGITLLTAGHFTPGKPGTQLLIVGSDGSARLSTLAADGDIRPQAAVTGPPWTSYVRLLAGHFTDTTGTVGDQVLAVRADGHLDLIAVGVGGRAAVRALPGLQLTPAETAAAFTGPGPGGHDALFAADSTGTVTAHTPTEAGFDPARPAGHLTMSAAGTTPVAGHFTSPNTLQILSDRLDGQVILTPFPVNPPAATGDAPAHRLSRNAYFVRIL